MTCTKPVPCSYCSWLVDNGQSKGPKQQDKEASSPRQAGMSCPTQQSPLQCTYCAKHLAVCAISYVNWAETVQRHTFCHHEFADIHILMMWAMLLVMGQSCNELLQFPSMDISSILIAFFPGAKLARVFSTLISTARLSTDPSAMHSSAEGFWHRDCLEPAGWHLQERQRLQRTIRACDPTRYQLNYSHDSPK